MKGIQVTHKVKPRVGHKPDPVQPLMRLRQLLDPLARRDLRCGNGDRSDKSFNGIVAAEFGGYNILDP